MKKEGVRVSICMATYNGASFLKEQLDSILSQMNECDELIISDNRSSDGTRCLLNAYADPRVNIFTFDKRGVIFNFENALKRAKGKFIFLADQDDVWLPGRLEIMVNALEISDLVLGNAIIANEDLCVSKPPLTLFDLNNPSQGILSNLVKNSFTGCCMAFNRKILGASLPFPKTIPMHDWWIGALALRLGKVSFISEPTILYRRHGGNASTLTSPSKNTYTLRLRMRMDMLIALMLRLWNLKK